VKATAKVVILDASYEKMRLAVDAVFERFPLDVAGKTVLLKPNMVGMYEPETHANTHPAVIRALVERLRQDGATVTVGDNPGTSGYGAVEKSARISGLMEASLGAFENIARESQRVKLTGHDVEVNISRKVLETDVLISVPKFKTHVMTHVTGAIKNSYGFLVGGDKARLHLDYPRYPMFSEIVTEVYRLRVPDLIVMDAVVGIQVNGPQNKFLYHVGKLMASDNGVALDSVMSRMMGMKPETIRSIEYAHELGLGPIAPEEIEIEGDAGKLKRFRRPVPSIPQRFSGTWIMAFFPDIGRPRFDVDEYVCTSCRSCADICPAGAITVEKKGAPEYDYEKCIACYCCRELCPQTALHLHETFRTRLYRRLGYM
jgi:uncharacterized protein (DUF362 family)/Pyruvate/2-oxoacid:ferredoxin oxidoreductase delta subunit